jgi:hypothetical protein
VYEVAVITKVVTKALYVICHKSEFMGDIDQGSQPPRTDRLDFPIALRGRGRLDENASLSHADIEEDAFERATNQENGGQRGYPNVLSISVRRS